MILIIDAYNVLKQVISSHIGETDRDAFIRLLNQYHKNKKHTIIAVFDGGPTDRPFVEMHGAVRIVFSGKETADHYIIDYVQQHKNLDILIISSDRALIQAGEAVHIPSLDAHLFYGLLKNNDHSGSHVKKSQQSVKISSEQEPELDALMLEGDMDEKNEEQHDARRSTSHTLSKHDRLLLRKLKKL